MLNLISLIQHFINVELQLRKVIKIDFLFFVFILSGKVTLVSVALSRGKRGAV